MAGLFEATEDFGRPSRDDVPSPASTAASASDAAGADRGACEDPAVDERTKQQFSCRDAAASAAAAE